MSLIAMIVLPVFVYAGLDAILRIAPEVGGSASLSYEYPPEPSPAA
jgi:hypothetical protein